MIRLGYRSWPVIGMVSSQLVEVEAVRAVDRERLLAELAPIVFVTNTGGTAWFSVTGH